MAGVVSPMRGSESRHDSCLLPCVWMLSCTNAGLWHATGRWFGLASLQVQGHRWVSFLSLSDSEIFPGIREGIRFHVCLHWQLTTTRSSCRAWSPRPAPQAPIAPVGPACSAHLCPSRGSLGCIACPPLFSGSPNGGP